MISQKDPKSKGIEGAFMEKSEMRKLAEFIEKLSWDDLPEEVKPQYLPGPGSDQRCLGAVD